MKKRIILSGLLSICMFFTACSNSAEVAGTPEDTGRVLKMAIASETTLLSPLYMGNSNFCTATLVYENLVNYEDGKIVPGLAESWKFSEDGRKLTFHLRPNAVFHDGKPCNAEAVKANLEHKHSNPSFYTLKAVTDFESIEVVDDTTLTINYTHPYFAYLNDFCWQDVMTIVSPDLLIAGDFQTVKGVVGTGPYVYDEIVSGQYTRFVRNESYWGEKPYYDEILVKYIPDSASRIQALKTGEIDMIYGSALMSYEEYRQASAIPGMKGQIADKDTRARDITLNASRPGLSDLKVRQAIAYGINKDEISEGLTYGYEGKAEIPFTLDSPYSDIPLEKVYSYNQDKAKELLDEAGWLMNEATGVREKDGKPLKLLLTMDASFDSLNKSLATLLQSQLSKIGAEVSIKGMEQMEWYSCFVEGSFDITIWQPQYAYASPHCWFTPMDSTTPQTASLKGMKDSKEFLDKIKETTQTDNKDKLTELFTYLYNYDLGNVIDIPLTYSKDMIVYNSSKIGGYSFKGTPCFFDVSDLKQAE
ncbi:peptide/nickel transport system substrate-binding protein/nickel transport system substrate-binding protein [Ruminiclostridium sufflavum DSM 19573]|uniref:Peptide/nickel transport system substrate-binding protein/nickel transport system substrate-binding protein n=1 Tax=Ruminiclostridium sufflavum DSM 19573 TaxID=1121337 RepID=A0A318XRX1_9FIRM|nr:ABC transporter substrate-binding protein [Ruminiclostridium sufflavum]PYG90254.1 peptide/nickel transport system substrate-binding protein/nickel transport system substrate-binding protein [Ruminiclostridium sufflavum DSM 19573]